MKIKTKFMPCTIRSIDPNNCFEIGRQKFKTINSFTYMGSEINNKNSITAEIGKKINAGNK